jgi:hypothetical protein
MHPDRSLRSRPVINGVKVFFCGFYDLHSRSGNVAFWPETADQGFRSSGLAILREGLNLAGSGPTPGSNITFH